MDHVATRSVRAGPMGFVDRGSTMSVVCNGPRLGTIPRGHRVHVARNGVRYSVADEPDRSAPIRTVAKKPSGKAGPADDLPAPFVHRLSEEEPSTLVDEIGSKTSRTCASLVFGALGLLAAFSISLGFGVPVQSAATIAAAMFAIGFAVGLRADHFRRSVVVLYELDHGTEAAYASLNAAFLEMRAVSGIWNVPAGRSSEDRRICGIPVASKLPAAKLFEGGPSVLRTNVSVPSIEAGDVVLHFMPDRIVVFDGGECSSVEYRDLVVVRERASFVLPGTKPSDAHVAYRVWLHSNIEGGRDRSSSSNRQLPVCVFETLDLGIPSGPHVRLRFSRQGAAEAFEAALATMVGTEAGRRNAGFGVLPKACGAIFGDARRKQSCFGRRDASRAGFNPAAEV